MCWVDRDGNTEELPLAAESYNYFDLSSDDQMLAVHVTDVEDYVFIYDFATSNGRKLVTDGAAGWPIWSPDGDQLLITRQVADGSYWVMRPLMAVELSRNWRNITTRTL